MLEDNQGKSKSDIAKPLISVVCITFNQVKYIDDAIQGILSQKTTVPFEVIIHDDASNDGTSDKLRFYAEKYPNLIKLIIRDENLYSRVSFGFVEDLFEMCAGEYIAFFEGDDYWIDDYKLEKQYIIMESNKKLSACIHNAIKKNEFTGASELFNGTRIKNLITSRDVLFLRWFSPTASFFMRKSFLKFPSRKDLNLDIPLLFNLSVKGPIFYIHEAMSVYRYGSEGSLSEKSMSDKLMLYKKKKSFYNYIDEEYGLNFIFYTFTLRFKINLAIAKFHFLKIFNDK